MSIFREDQIRESESPVWIWVWGGMIIGILGCLANVPDGINDRTGWLDYLVMPPMLIVPLAKRLGEGWWDASICVAIALQLPLFILISLLLRNWKNGQSSNN
jgi:hypothetical protein